MSETRNVEEQREPYVIELEEHVPFSYDAAASILTSTQLGTKISNLFRLVFPGDYEGCRIGVTNRGPELSLIFKHAVNRDENIVYGVELSSAKKTNNSTIDRIRNRDHAAQYGDRYSLTDDAKDALKGLLRREYLNSAGNGKINWGNLTSEEAFPAGTFYAAKNEQFTVIKGLDLNLVCGLLYGNKDADGNNVVYTVDVKGALGNPGFNMTDANKTYILWVNRINNDKLQETYASLGLGMVSNIIR